MLTKDQITQKLLDLAPPGFGVTMEEAMSDWWVSLRRNGGLRLTFHGYLAFTKLEVESWVVPMEDPKLFLDKRVLLDLGLKIHYPYYIDYKKKSLILFSSREALMATLHGNIKGFLNTSQPRRN